jgi:hypothetical protein
MSKPHLRFYVEEITIETPICPTMAEYEEHKDREPTKISRPYSDIVAQWEKMMELHVEGAKGLSYGKVPCLSFDDYMEKRDEIQNNGNFKYWLPLEDVEWAGDEVFKK